MTVHGYHGRYLRIDLSSGSHDAIALPEAVLRRFVGGSGLGTWLLLQETAGCIDPLGETAPLVFAFSPLVGSPLTTSAKFAVVAKSPLTERINDSLSSSHFAIAGKRTGFDAFVIVGRSKTPVTLLIEPGSVRVESANDIWGESSSRAAEEVRKRHGRSWRVAAIGPAGENLVRFATVSHDGRHAGRGGLGAVMGAKQLKALAVRGDRRTTLARPDELIAYSKDLSRQSFGPATAKYRELGTVANLLAFNRLGTLPTRNFQSGSFAAADKLAPETINQTHRKTRESCAACTIGCEHIYQLSPASRSSDHGASEGTAVRMEYENLFALGSLCGVEDPETVLRASALCDDLGIDTISAGATVAFAMECAERGYIRAPGLRFGNGEVLLQTLAKIGSRTEIGDLLAGGSRRAALQIGHDSIDFAPQVKGLEIPGYEPRALQTMALGFAVGARGADHNRSGAYQADFSGDVDRRHALPADVHYAIATEDEAAIMDSLILCKFLRGVFSDRMAAMAQMLGLVTGWDVETSELHRTAARIVTAKKLYNMRQGWSPEEDTLPKRFLTQELSGGASEGATLSEDVLRTQVAAYNLARGWSADGFPTAEQLAELDLDGTGACQPHSS